MRYPIHNKKAYCLLFIVDTFLTCVFFWKREKKIPLPIKILISNTAHLGDIILSTSLLSLLKNAFPHVTLGMVVSSASAVVIKNHPLVNHIHICDHWKTNRSSLSIFKKYTLYRKSHRKTLSEIKKVHYDVVLDVNFHFPNLAFLLWKANIPLRLGFASAGFGPLMTHTLPWQAEDVPVIESFFRLASILGKMDPSYLKPNLSKVFHKKENTIVIHPGTGDPRKKWPVHKWRELTQILSTRGYRLLFTGKGIEEKQEIQEITKEIANTQDLSDSQSWEDFVETIANATLLITVDSAAAHIAACTKTAALVISTRINPLKMWSPQGKNIHLIYRSPPCASCLKGCASMHCIQEISVSEVLKNFCVKKFG